MNPNAWTPRSAMSPAERQRIHDEAHHRAVELRREAMSDFWRGTNAWLESVSSSTLRAGNRLASRLRRHAAQRAAPPAAACCASAQAK